MGSFTIAGKEYTPQELIAQAMKAPGILGAIAGFSVINSVLVLFGAEISFVIGLGMTAVADGFLLLAREEVEGGMLLAVTLIGLAFNAAIIGVFLLLWWLSRRGSRAAYIIACVIYSADTLIFLAVQDWVGVGFHAFFLFMLFTGYAFVKRRSEAEAMLLEATEAQAGPVADGSGPPPLYVPPVPASVAELPVNPFEEQLEALWTSFPDRQRALEGDIDARGGGEVCEMLARQGYAQSSVGVEWTDEHTQIVREHLEAQEHMGYGDSMRQFSALALGTLLGMHAVREVDDDGYQEGGRMLDDFVARMGAD